MALKAVLFDMDGTLFDTFIANVFAYRMAFSEQGLSFSEADYRQVFGRSFKSWGPSIYGFTAEQVARIAERKAEIYPDFFYLIKPNMPLLSFAGSLDGLSQRALFTAASQRNAHAILKQFDVTALFDRVFCSEDLPGAKQDAASLQFCIDSLNVTAEACLLIDDDESVRGHAEAFGMKALHPGASENWKIGLNGLVAHAFKPSLSRFYAENLCRGTDQNITVIKPMAGGSAAYTLLRSRGDGLEVQKIAFGADAEKLSKQAEWLTQNQSLQRLPKVKERSPLADSFAYTMEYLAQHQTMSSIVHQQSLKQSRVLLGQLVAFLEEGLYETQKDVLGPTRLAHYVEQKFYEKLAESTSLHEGIARLEAMDALTINGEPFSRLSQTMVSLSSCSAFWNSLANSPLSTIHGDLSLENILVKGRDFVLIDPNPEDLFPTRFLDYAKIFTSLRSGFEFLKELQDVTVHEQNIAYQDLRSHQYQSLFHFLRRHLSTFLSDLEICQILFHEAIHFTRMLPYRIRINPRTAPAFYAAAARSLSLCLTKVSSLERRARPTAGSKQRRTA